MSDWQSRIKKEWLTNNFHNEDQFQAEAIKMISQEFPRLRDKFWHTLNDINIPKDTNESEDEYQKRLMFFRGRLKALGVLAGVMDILIVHRGVLYKIELKQPDGSLSNKQKDIHQIWNTDNPLAPCVVCRTLHEVYMACRKIVDGSLIVQDFDYKSLLEKYVNHVFNIEGTTFTDELNITWAGTVFKDKELEILKSIKNDT